LSPLRDEVASGWRKLHIEELHKLYSSPNKIRMTKPRRIKWVGHVAHTGKNEWILDFGGKLRRKISSGRPGRRW
jgi:hypothetical protein